MTTSLQRASNGAPVNLGRLIGRGGEGAVHAVIGAPKLVAKVYLKVPDAAKSEKLRLMIRGKSPGLLGVAAWPVDLLTDERGAVRGFLMGRISARQDAHRLYTPKSRRGTFPSADFRFVVRAATNLARAFAQIHAAGHVIGDVNHGNALIGKDGTAVLIDCDSIQIREQGRTFPCDVGTPLFTPPELQGKAFRGLKRDEVHDRFGLAVLIFHLLFQGRHPFAGVSDGEMPLERAIAESRFAYGSNAAALGMSQPPGTLALATFGTRIAGLFEHAFAPPGSTVRPSAIEWIEALQELENELTVCPRSPRHFHPRGESCCWCDIEILTGARLFDDGQESTAEADAVTAEELWKAIEGVHPPLDLELPKFAVQRPDAIPGNGAGARFMGSFSGGLLTVLAGGGLAVATMGLSRGVAFSLFFLSLLVGSGVVASSVGSPARPSRLRRALRIEWDNALAQWRKHGSSSAYASALLQLEKSRHSLRALVEQQRTELASLVRLLEPRQCQAFLDTFEIDKVLFVDVTRSHIEKLATWGIRSAGDVRRHRNMLSGLVSAAAASELRDWAQQCAKEFKFDTSDATYVGDAAEIEGKYRRRRQVILATLRNGPALLTTRRDEIADARARADDVLRQKHEQLRKGREKVDQ